MALVPLILVGMVFTLVSFTPAILFYGLARLADRPQRVSPGQADGQPPAGPAGDATLPDHFYPGPVPNPPGSGRRRISAARVSYPSVTAPPQQDLYAMSTAAIIAIVLALAMSVIGVTLFAGAVGEIVGVVRIGRPVAGRSDRPSERWKHLLAETLGHTRMLQWTTVGVAHWFVFVAFGALFFTLVTAYGQLFDPALRAAGHRPLGGLRVASELIAWAGLISIVLLDHRPAPAPRAWAAVPLLRLPDLAGGLCRTHHPRHRRLRLLLRALEYQLLGAADLAGCTSR